VNFAYVSMLHSPFGGAAHWSWKDGHELALVSDSDMRTSPRWRPPPPPQNFPSQQFVPRNTTRMASSPAPRPVTPPPSRR
jgi:hypothetical protein